MKNKRINLNTTYGKLVVEMERYAQAMGYKDGTKKAIKWGLISFLEWLESKNIYAIEKVNRGTIKRYHEYLKNRPNKMGSGGLSSSMIVEYLWTVRMLFKYQEQCEKIKKNPMSGYPSPKVENQKRMILNRSEIEQLYEVCETIKERIVLHLYYGLGLRRSEGVALNIKDIDFKNGWLYVLEGKGGKSRNVPLAKGIQSDFKQYLLGEERRLRSSALLLNKQQNRLQGYSALKILRKLLKRANLNEKIDLHCLRHSIATHLIKEEMPVEQVRVFLGHDHLETTQKYIHYEPTEVFKSAL
jgi:integrase/recombinase XerD